MTRECHVDSGKESCSLPIEVNCFGKLRHAVKDVAAQKKKDVTFLRQNAFSIAGSLQAPHAGHMIVSSFSRMPQTGESYVTKD